MRVTRVGVSRTQVRNHYLYSVVVISAKVVISSNNCRGERRNGCAVAGYECCICSSSSRSTSNDEVDRAPRYGIWHLVVVFQINPNPPMDTD